MQSLVNETHYFLFLNFLKDILYIKMTLYR